MGLVHYAIFLFFIGLLIYIFNTDRSIFGPIVYLVSICVTTYFVVIWPLFMHAVHAMLEFSLSSCIPFHAVLALSMNVETRTKNIIRKLTTEIDDRILKWLFDTQFEDSDLVQFLESIPGFCRSSVVMDPLRRVNRLGKEKLTMTMKTFLEHTWSSHFLSEEDKMRRLVVCVEVVDAVRLRGIALSILKDILPWDRHKVLRSLEMGQLLRSLGNNTQQDIGLCAQSIVAGIISNVQGSDDRWIALAADQIGKSEGVILGYLECGNDNILLANLNYITRQIFHAALGDDLNRDMAAAASYILPTLSNLDIQNALPGLQHDFLALWNEIDEKIEEAPNNGVLREIRGKLVQLYQGLNQVSEDVHTIPPVPDATILAYPSESTSPSFLLAPSPANEPSTGEPPDAMQPIAQVAVSPHTASEPLEGRGLSNDLQDPAVLITTIPSHSVANTSSRDQSTLRPDPNRVPPADTHSPIDSARIPSSYIPRDDRPAPSPAIPEVASIVGPNGSSTAPLGAHYDTQDMSDQTAMNRASSSHAHQSDPSAEGHTPSDDAA
jgi:hypothetical protein